MSYKQEILALDNPTFEGIRGIAWKQIAHLSRSEQEFLHSQLNRGVALLDADEHLSQYLNSYGKMHQAKLLDAFGKLPTEVLNYPFQIVDWGCGQALGTINLFDFIHSQGMDLKVNKVTLIEPSSAALERGVLHTKAYLRDAVPIDAIKSYFEEVQPDQITSERGVPVIHIFSNILDVAQIDLKHLANLVDKSVVSDNFVVCVGPLNATNHRIDAFYNYFDVPLLYSRSERGFVNNRWTYKCNLYRLEYNESSHLIPIEYYPTVQFQAAYELDAIQQNRKSSSATYLEKFSHFEVAAPFDLGASVYDDVHPILAVLNNIVCRGLPTKASVFLEEKMAECFGRTTKSVELGEMAFNATQEVRFTDLNTEFVNQLDRDHWQIDDKVGIQLLLVPLAVARFQKVLIEALITDHLSLAKDRWKILVEEGDVPFAALAVKDFQMMFHHLTQLSEEFQSLTLPAIELHVVSNSHFCESPLHLGANVYADAPQSLTHQEFDFVVTQSILKSVNSSIESFSKYKSKNNCYFNIRTIDQKKTDRTIYTSGLIHYQPLVEKNPQGVFIEQEEPKEHLTYFLQLFFRKQAFRPGQLPILDRALRNLPVIGLLPTGGGKSLTYQIATLLQPGVSIVVDPLKALMKDQYDGLINSGIDCCGYINSSLSYAERKKRENQLQSSELLFIFLSPERLAIATFRERLRNMHDQNVYFSYGVIDEVHCVSEWGHDFRFSYLHLGRNLYNYVKAKEGEISLFGLTATASFDVLADVERELSSNGAFELDADTIVRYENTNRLELQYKIEKVPVPFSNDQFYDQNNTMPAHLPKAVNITNHWSSYDAKAEFLKGYIEQVPQHLTDIQSDENIALIKSSFVDRQNSEEGVDSELEVAMPVEFWSENVRYNEAGIIFCPHVNTTGISVQKNAQNLQEIGIRHVGSFSGGDDDNTSMRNLELFRDHKLPIMVATKAFGMGIDKPNVRFTVNMNYPSSLEAFVQEAGRAGRDRKMALATLLLSDYDLVSIKSSFGNNTFPIPILRNKWFRNEDLKTILNEYGIEVPEEYLLRATPQNDIVKLHCGTDNRMFGRNECSPACNAFNTCKLRMVTPQTKGWKSEIELVAALRSQGSNIGKKNFQYLSADYHTVMYFFHEAFQGDFIERKYMNDLLNNQEVRVSNDAARTQFGTENGFLPAILRAEIEDRLMVFIKYDHTNIRNLSKAIYRMCCIELIEDFTQDYRENEFRIVAARKSSGGYFEGLKQFLRRYYTPERAEKEITKAQRLEINAQDAPEVAVEIYRCLAYLTEFVYDKVSEKRKRAIDDMRNFCIDGLEENTSWVQSNEKLKDFIFYYFNSKYAKSDYVADNGEPFSLVEDTDGGKISTTDILFKYMRVSTDEEVIGTGTPLDNVKHLYGAVRLITRSLTDSNPALFLLDAYCLAYLGTRNNQNLKNQLFTSYTNGMLEFANRLENPDHFWRMFDAFNKSVLADSPVEDIQELFEEVKLLTHAQQLQAITHQYTENYG